MLRNARRFSSENDSRNYTIMSDYLKLTCHGHMWGVVGVEALGGERVLDVLAAHVGGEDDVDVEVDDGDTRHQKADNCEFQLHFVFSDPESHWDMKKLTLFLPRRLRSDRTRNKILAATRSNNLLTGGHLLIN